MNYIFTVLSLDVPVHWIRHCFLLLSIFMSISLFARSNSTIFHWADLKAIIHISQSTAPFLSPFSCILLAPPISEAKYSHCVLMAHFLTCESVLQTTSQRVFLVVSCTKTHIVLYCCRALYQCSLSNRPMSVWKYLEKMYSCFRVSICKIWWFLGLFLPSVLLYGALVALLPCVCLYGGRYLPYSKINK